MKSFELSGMPFVTAIVFAAVFSGTASANCNFSRTSQLRAGSAAMLSSPIDPLTQATRPQDDRGAASAAPEPSIAGFWYVRFMANGQLVDDGFDMWNSDGTETLNDSPAPSTGNVCLGVWTKTAPFTYTLKHPSWIFDTTGVNLIGIAIIREQITLHAGGNSYSGEATLDVYDTAGHLLDHESSQLAGQRISALDDPKDHSPIPGLPHRS